MLGNIQQQLRKIHKISRMIVVIPLLLLSPLFAAQSVDAVLFSQARTAARAGELDSAIAMLRVLLGNYPHHYHGWLELAELYRKKNLPDRAMCACSKALVANPGWTTACRLLADILVEKGKSQQAISLLETCLPHGSSKSRAELQERITALRSKRPVETEIAFERWDTLTPAPSRTPQIEELFRKAVSQYEARNYAAALTTVRKVLELQPDHGGAYYYAGLIRHRRGEKELARINFLKGLRYPELGYNAHYYLARLYAEKRDYVRAIAHIQAYLSATTYEAGKREALKLLTQYRSLVPNTPQRPPDSKNPDTLRGTAVPIQCDFPPSYLLPLLEPIPESTGVSTQQRSLREAIACLQTGRFEQASLALQKWIDSTDTLMATWVLYNLGVSQFRIGERRRAAASFHAFLGRISKTENSYELVTRILYAAALGDSTEDDGERELKAILGSEKYPPNLKATVWHLLADLLKRRQRWWESEEAYRRALGLFPRGSDTYLSALHGRGVALAASGKDSRALSVFAALRDEARTYETPRFIPESWYRTAEIYLTRGSYRQALSTFSHVVDSFSDFLETPWGLFQIQLLADRLGDSTRAQRAAEKLYSHFSDDYWARQNIPRVRIRQNPD